MAPIVVAADLPPQGTSLEVSNPATQERIAEVRLEGATSPDFLKDFLKGGSVSIMVPLAISPENNQLSASVSRSFEKRLNENGRIESFKSAELSINLDPPFPDRPEYVELLTENFTKAVERIEKAFPNQELDISTATGNRLEFEAQGVRGTEKWVATHLDLLKVKVEPDSEIVNEWEKQKGIVEAHWNALESYAEQTGTTVETLEEFKYSLEDKILRGEELLPIEKMWQSIEAASLKERELHKKSSKTVYERADHKPGMGLVVETRDLENVSKFERQYFDNTGQPEKEVAWRGQGSDERYYQNAESVREVSYKKGKIVSSADLALNTETYYDSEIGRALITRSWGEEAEVLILNEDGESCGTFRREKEKDPGLTEEVYLKRFSVALTTENSWELLDSVLYDALNNPEEFPESLTLSIRELGREKLGITELEHSLSAVYGISVHTENLKNLKNYSVDADRYSLKDISRALKNIDGWLAIYPDEFIRNSGVKDIYVFKNWQGHVKEEAFRAGGFSFDKHTMGVGLFDERAFHHELFHTADRNEGGLKNDNHDWGTDKFGSGYEQLYGNSGMEALTNGLAHGERPEGFASAYAKYGGIDEDQAETAEALFMDYEETMSRAEKEPALMSSVKNIKEFYYTASEGKMDDKFWQYRGSRMHIDNDYWMARRVLNDFSSSPSVKMNEDSKR